eukprot:4255324-Prymnesium_polylepis.1
MNRPTTTPTTYDSEWHAARPTRRGSGCGSTWSERLRSVAMARAVRPSSHAYQPVRRVTSSTWVEMRMPAIVVIWRDVMRDGRAWASTTWQP